MGWTWDHGKTRTGRSYSNHADLGAHLRSIAPGWAWQAVKELWAHPSDKFGIQPGDAARMAEALHALAPLTQPTWQQAVYDLAASAREAARMNAVWHWS
jgi:hypothetical protein